jgi:hypothetical protein
MAFRQHGTGAPLDTERARKLQKKAPGQRPGASVPGVARSVLACQHAEVPGSSKEDSELNSLFAHTGMNRSMSLIYNYDRFIGLVQ